MNATKENNYTCGTCKHQESCPQAWSFDEQDLHNIDQTTCGEWTDPDEPDPLTEDEKREILGDRKAHEIMEEGREIL